MKSNPLLIGNTYMEYSGSTSGDSAAVIEQQPASRLRLIVATGLGNGLEIFDFTIFSFFATIIGKEFFPSHTQFGSLLMAVATFGAGFIVRPLGGIVLGNYADRAGRKASMTLTILLMALGTAGIGLTPTYARIGLLAPVLIVASRLLQGFSAGGEVGVSTTLLMESGGVRSRGFMTSWQSASQGGAALAGALSGFALSHLLTHAQLESWGWRLPFLLGLLIGPVGLYIRNRLPETYRNDSGGISAFRELLQSYRGVLVLGIMIFAGRTALMYIFVFYMPTYMISVLHMARTTAFLSGCVAGGTLLLVSPLAGLLADRLERRKGLIVWPTIVGTVLIYPAFWLLNQAAALGVALAIIAAFVACLTLGASASFLLLTEVFPKRVRSTGLSVIYSFGAAVFGGFAQFIVTWLISVTGNPLSPVWYAIAGSLITLFALWRFPERRVE
jgi:MHS family proline/betaine transporter-like MFS transporter